MGIAVISLSGTPLSKTGELQSSRFGAYHSVCNHGSLHFTSPLGNWFLSTVIGVTTHWLWGYVGDFYRDPRHNPNCTSKYILYLTTLLGHENLPGLLSLLAFCVPMSFAAPYLPPSMTRRSTSRRFFGLDMVRRGWTWLDMLESYEQWRFKL